MYGINHHKGWPDFQDRLLDQVKVCFRKKQHLFGQRGISQDPQSSGLHLVIGFLTGDIQHFPLSCHLQRHLQQQRRFPDSGVTSD